MNLKKIILIVLGVGVFLLLAIVLILLILEYNLDDFKYRDDPMVYDSLVQEQILEHMQKSGEKLYRSPSIQLERSSKVIEYMGFINTESTEKIFGINIEYVERQNLDGSTVVAPEGEDDIYFLYNEAIEQKLSPAAGYVIPVLISAKSSAAGNYLYKVNALTETVPGACAQGLETPGCELYATKSFLVRVS